jgi:uncharacterized protein YjiS (DUF1127 family)
MEDVITSPARSWAATPYSPFRGVRRWYRERHMANALEALNDATLKDIGICRCEIPWIARNYSATDAT